MEPLREIRCPFCHEHIMIVDEESEDLAKTWLGQHLAKWHQREMSTTLQLIYSKKKIRMQQPQGNQGFKRGL